MRHLTKIVAVSAALTLVSAAALANTPDNAYKNTFTTIINNSSHPVVVQIRAEHGSSFINKWTNAPITTGYSITLQPGGSVPTGVFNAVLTGTPISGGYGYESSERISVFDASTPSKNSIEIHTSLGETPYKIAETVNPVGSLGANVSSDKNVGPNGMDFTVVILPYTA